MAKQKGKAGPVESGPGDLTNPQTPEQFVERGWTYYSKQDFNRAGEDFKKALEMAPENPEIWYNLAMTQEFSGQKEEAVQNYEKSIEILERPDYPDHVRASMLGRLARGHINRIRTGDWNLGS